MKIAITPDYFFKYHQINEKFIGMNYLDFSENIFNQQKVFDILYLKRK